MGQPGALSSTKPEKWKSLPRKNFLYFSKKNFFLIFWDGTFQPQAKTISYIFPQKIFLYFLIQIENTVISSVKRVKLPGVHIDGRLDFEYQVRQICKKTSKKYTLYLMVCKYIDQNKRRMLMNALIISQFSYCPLVWMFHSRNRVKLPESNCHHKLTSKSLEVSLWWQPLLEFW